LSGQKFAGMVPFGENMKMSRFLLLALEALKPGRPVRKGRAAADTPRSRTNRRREWGN